MAVPQPQRGGEPQSDTGRRAGGGGGQEARLSSTPSLLQQRRTARIHVHLDVSIFINAHKHLIYTVTLTWPILAATVGARVLLSLPGPESAPLFEEQLAFVHDATYEGYAAGSLHCLGAFRCASDCHARRDTDSQQRMLISSNDETKPPNIIGPGPSLLLDWEQCRCRPCRDNVIERGVISGA